MNVKDMIDNLKGMSHADLMVLEKAVVEAKRVALATEREVYAKEREAKEAEKVKAKVEKAAAPKAAVSGTMTKDSFDIGDMVEFTFNKKVEVGRVMKVNEKSVVIAFHKVFRDVNADVEQRFDIEKVVRNLTKSAVKTLPESELVKAVA